MVNGGSRGGTGCGLGPSISRAKKENIKEGGKAGESKQPRAPLSSSSGSTDDGPVGRGVFRDKYNSDRKVCNHF